MMERCCLSVVEDLGKECQVWCDYKGVWKERNKDMISEYTECNSLLRVFEGDPEHGSRVEYKVAGELVTRSLRGLSWQTLTPRDVDVVIQSMDPEESM